VIAELLGVPAEDQEWFKEMSNAIAQFDPTRPGASDPDAKAMGPAIELGRYLAEVLAQRRHEPRDDLLSALVAAEIDGQRLSEPELIRFAFLPPARRLPGPGTGTHPTAPMTLHGVTIPEGSQVLLLFGSANHDERRIADPERLDVLRDANPQLAFGFGAHFCLGANLARLEARVAFQELLAPLPDYRMTGTRVERTCSGPVRGALNLPVAMA
jgi:cytochrome P450